MRGVLSVTLDTVSYWLHSVNQHWSHGPTHSITILTVVWYLINPWAPKNSSGKIRAKCSETEDLNAPPPNLEIGFKERQCNWSKCERKTLKGVYRMLASHIRATKLLLRPFIPPCRRRYNTDGLRRRRVRHRRQHPAHFIEYVIYIFWARLVWDNI